MNTNLNQLLKDLEIGPAYVKILIASWGVLLCCTRPFFTSPVFSGNFLYTNRYFSHRAVPLCIRGSEFFFQR